MRAFMQRLREHPVIAAARDAQGVLAAAASPACAVFVLGSSILELPEIMRTVRDAEKAVFIHLDLLEGLGHDAAAVEWCAKHIRPDGLISTRSSLLKAAKSCGLLTIQRLFVTDSSALRGGVRQLQQSRPDMVEILPGLMPKVIAELKRALPDTPVIAGGMVTDAREVLAALAAGAYAVSTSERLLWTMPAAAEDIR